MAASKKLSIIPATNDEKLTGYIDKILINLYCDDGDHEINESYIMTQEEYNWLSTKKKDQIDQFGVRLWDEPQKINLFKDCYQI